MVWVDYLLKIKYKDSYAGQLNMQEFQFELQACIKSKQRTKLNCFHLSTHVISFYFTHIFAQS